MLSVCQPQLITAPGRVNCKAAPRDTGGNNPWRSRSQAVRQIHLNRSRASHPTLISMTQRTRFVRDLNALHHRLIEKRDRWLCKPCGVGKPHLPCSHGLSALKGANIGVAAKADYTGSFLRLNRARLRQIVRHRSVREMFAHRLIVTRGRLLNYLHDLSIETRDRLLCKPSGAFC